MTAATDPVWVQDDLEVLLAEVLGSLMGEQARPAPDERLGEGAAVSARLGIHDTSDDSHLTVQVLLGLPLATMLAGRMMGVETPDRDDIVDTVGELGNICAGNVRSLLCSTARLSLPSAQIVDPPGGCSPQIGGPAVDHEGAPSERGDDGVRVRVAVMGHAVQLTVVPGAGDGELLWPPAAFESAELARQPGPRRS